MPLTIYRCMHKPEELNETFEKLFRDCDILFMELATSSSHRGVSEFYRQISFEGRSDIPITAFSKREGGLIRKLGYLLLNSKKQVVIEKSPYTREYFTKKDSALDSSLNAFLRGDLERSCETYLEYSKYMAEMTKGRDDSLVEQLRDLEKENKDKNILILFGAGHTIYGKLKKEGFDVRQELAEKPFIVQISDEILRRNIFGKEIKKELLAQHAPYSYVLLYLQSLGIDDYESMLRARRAAEQLSYEDIQALSTHLSERYYRRKNPQESIVLWLRKKGIEI